MPMSKQRYIVCCRGCGRDTSGPGGICSRCTGRGLCWNHYGIVGRKELNTNQRAESPLAPDGSELDRRRQLRAADRYHGDSIRDDL